MDSAGYSQSDTKTGIGKAVIEKKRKGQEL
jgi:hypothetical protein